MKTWIIPEVSELNINETANGFVDACFESLIVFNKKKATPDPTPTPIPTPIPTPTPIPIPDPDPDQMS